MSEDIVFFKKTKVLRVIMMTEQDFFHFWIFGTGKKKNTNYKIGKLYLEDEKIKFEEFEMEKRTEGSCLNRRSKNSKKD